MKKELFKTRINEETESKIRNAQSQNLLVVEFQKKTNLECDICGKNEVMDYVIVVVHTSKENMENDSMGGDAYVFGSSCWKKFAKKVLA